jgi:flagellar protein FlaG
MTYNITSVLPSKPVSAPDTGRTTTLPAVESQPASGRDQTLPPDVKHTAAGNNNLEQTVKHLNEYAQTINREVQFSIDKASGRSIVKVIDSKTNEVIRQMPSEEMLALGQTLGGSSGLVIRAKA